jgi:translocation and assembly module TamB
MEGTLGGDSVTLDHLIRCEHAGMRLSHLSGALRVGHDGRIDGQWHRPTFLNASGNLFLEHLPLQHVASAIGCVPTRGLFDGQCHYQSTSRTVVAKGQVQATIARLGVIGSNDGGVALGGTFSIEDSMAKAQVCVAGMGIKEPLMVALSCPISRIQKTPWISVHKNTPLQGSIRGSIHLSQLLASWMPTDAGFESIIGCDVTIGGTAGTPLFHGPISLREGRIDLLPTGEVISNIEMDAQLVDRQLTVSRITATDEKQGTIEGSGWLEMTQDNDVRWQAVLNGSDVEVVALDYAMMTADATVKLVGDLSSITISGSAKAKKTLIDLAARFPSDVPEIAVTYHDETQQRGSPYLVFFDLSVDGTIPIEIKGRGLTSTWEGHVHLGGEAENVSVDGTLHCREGSFMIATKELNISEGSIAFAGDVFTDSRLNVIANITLPTITAQVSLKGSFKTPKLVLQSTPPKTDNEILSLVLFNKEFGDISPLQSLQLANTAMTFQRASGPFGLLDKIKETLGIDLIDFGSPTSSASPSSSTPSNLDQTEEGPPLPDTQNDVSLKVGKYISEGVAVTVSKNVTSDANYLGLEAQLAPEISAEAEIGDNQEGIVSLKWKKNY